LPSVAYCLHKTTLGGIMAKGKRGAQQDGQKPKRGKFSQLVVPVDPVAEKCHTIAGAIQSADLPLVVKEVLVAVMPGAFAMHKDERHSYQEQMVQTIGDTLNDIEGNIQKRVAEAETRLKETIATEEKLKQEQTLAHEAVDAQSELLLDKKKALAQTAMKFREAKRSLAEARDAEQHACQEGKKLFEDKEVLTNTVTRFEPLKDGTLEPAQSSQETAHLLDSLKGRLELDETLSAALPNALVTPILQRSSFTTMVVHQFGDTLMAKIKDLTKQCEAEESTKEGFAAAVLAAEKALESVAAHQMEAADVFTTEKDALDVKTQTVQDKKKAVRDAGPLIRKCKSSLAELQVELDTFQTGPWEAFRKLQCPTKEVPENVVAVAPEGEGTTSAQDAEVEAAKPAMCL